ncbi:GSCFA domain-containing protein (plasmid) [Roseomonas marmotae]|uniref:GSCFA domain-containing protein n=1 Tax=Roseomonas marmotae TaxID=2768161 RepID=UPI001AD6E418|nr:GSCFA domain-containing protein [Roseomonas marmotae]QTI82193.1 GSCFA domain-containing protein [Roseomonas marmotae]
MPILSLPYGDAEQRLRSNREHGRWWFAENLPVETRALGASERLKKPALELLIRPNFRMGRTSNIFTIGSCFAREIEEAMLQDGMNVVSNPAVFTQWEPRAPAGLSDTEDHIFRMGYINKYTIGTMVDELRWAAEAVPTGQHPAVQEVSKGRFADLAAHNILAGDDEAAVRARRDAMSQLMRCAFQADVIVLTLGLAEGWRDQVTGTWLVDSPLTLKPEQPERYTLEVLSFADQMAGLREIAALLDRYGRPNWRMVLTVSPVPFLATFTGDDVVVANSYSKSVLRAAAEEFTRENNRADYFPSFEMANYSDAASVWKSDRRHIQKEFVQKIVHTFRGSYLQD